MASSYAVEGANAAGRPLAQPLLEAFEYVDVAGRSELDRDTDVLFGASTDKAALCAGP